MTPQERQLVDDLFDRLSKVESAPRDPDAAAAIAQGLRTCAQRVYALVQTVLVQDEALKQAHHRIEELEPLAPPSPATQSGGFLDSMRGCGVRDKPVAWLGAECPRARITGIPAAARSGTPAR